MSQSAEQPEIVRSAQEVQRAHDIVVMLITNLELSWAVFGPDAKIEKSLIAAADVLCWLLGHDHNQTFAENLRGIERSLQKLGYMIHDSGRLNTPEAKVQ